MDIFCCFCASGAAAGKGVLVILVDLHPPCSAPSLIWLPRAAQPRAEPRQMKYMVLMGFIQTSLKRFCGLIYVLFGGGTYILTGLVVVVYFHLVAISYHFCRPLVGIVLAGGVIGDHLLC